MIALFDNLSVFEDDNLVGIKDCLEAVSNDKASSASYNGFHSLLNLTLRHRIDIRSRFVQNQDLRIRRNVLAMEISCFCPVEKIF